MDELYSDDDGYASPIDDNEDDALSDKGEEELDRDEERIQNPATILNPDGTYRCPFCPGQMKQDYLFNEVLTHAQAQSQKTSRKGAKESRRHKMLVERLMRPDMKPAKPARAVNAAPLQAPAVVEDRILWPPVAIVKNLHTFWKFDPKQNRDILGGTTREELESTLNDYGPRKVDVLYSEWGATECKGHKWTAVIHFEGDAKGWEATSINMPASLLLPELRHSLDPPPSSEHIGMGHTGMALLLFEENAKGLQGHTGMALLLFEENAKGWEAASKLDKTYSQAGLGREGYANGRRRETKELFAWTAREQDLKEENEKGPLGSALHKKHNATKSLREVLDEQESVKRQQEREERRVQERAFMRLSERLQDTEGRLKEMEDSAMQLRKKHEQVAVGRREYLQEGVLAGGSACRRECLQEGVPAGGSACRRECLQSTEGLLKEMEDFGMTLRKKEARQELAEAHAYTQEVVERQMRDRMREVRRMEGEMEWLQRQLKERSANEQETRRRLEVLTRQLKQQEQQGELQQQQAQRRA
ncbi:unnamed protein product, partial [Closterium sp. Yama58-4]